MPKITEKVISKLILAVMVLAFFVMLAPHLLGCRFEAILSGSMSPALRAGDLAVVVPVNPYSVQIGDIIAYRSRSDSDTLIVHRVAGIDRSGSLSFRTKGDANQSLDAYPVPAQNVVGRMSYHLPWMGHCTRFAQSTLGFIFLLVIPGAAIIYGEVNKLWVALKPQEKLPKGKAALKPEETPPKGKAALKLEETLPKGKVALKPEETPPKGKATLKPEETLPKGKVALKPEETLPKGKVTLKPEEAPPKGKNAVNSIGFSRHFMGFSSPTFFATSSSSSSFKTESSSFSRPKPTGRYVVLSPMRKQILDFINDFTQKKGHAPAVIDIGKGCGISSPSILQYHLSILEREGLYRSPSKQSQAA